MSTTAIDDSSKLIALTSFLLFDLILNSIVDYSYFSYQVNLGLSGLEIVIQITIFLILFLGFTETYLFRVGLIGYLLKKFQGVLYIHPVYFIITIIDIALRLSISNGSSSNGLLTLWQDNSFIAVSYIQKFGIYSKYYLYLNIALSNLHCLLYVNSCDSLLFIKYSSYYHAWKSIVCESGRVGGFS